MSRLQEIWRSYVLALSAVFRDKGVLLLVLVGPIIYSVYYPFPYSSESVYNVPVGVVDLDRSSLSRKLVRLSDASPSLEVVYIANSSNDLRQAMFDGKIEGGLIIPANFRRDVLHGKSVKPIVLGNGAYFLFNKAQLQTFAGAIKSMSIEAEIAREFAKSPSLNQATERIAPVTLNLRASANPLGGYSTYVVPAIAVIVLQQTLLLGVCMLVGTWKTTAAPFNLVRLNNKIALVLVAATLCFINALYYIGIVYWWEDYPQIGKFSDLAVVIAAFSLTTGAWVVAIASFIRYREQGALHLLPTTIVIVFLAGFAWPFESIPQPLVLLAKLIPSTAGIQAFLKVDQMGAQLHHVIPELQNLLLLFGTACIVIVLRNRWPLPSSA